MTVAPTKSRRRLCAAALAGTCALGVASGSSHAVGDDVDDKIKNSKSEIDDISKSLADADAALTKTNKAVAAADKKAKDAKSALTKAQQKQRDAASDYDVAKADEDASRTALATNRADQAKARTEVGGLARNAFETGGLGDLTFTIEVLTSNSGVSGSMALADIVMRRQQGVITNLKSSAAAGQSEATRLAEIRRRASLAKTKQDAAVTAASTAKTDADTAEASLVALQKTQKDDKKKLEAEKKKEEAKLAALQAESTRLKNVTTTSKDVDTSVHDVPQGTGFLASPGPISSIVSGYGYRFHPVLKINKLHEGDDFPFACGTPVYAAGDGTVIEANYNDVSGNHVYISHGTVNGAQLTSAYMHFTSLSVSVGQKVKKGQQIGVSGMTGRVTGCHLHFETRENGVAVNPLKWIK